MPGISLYVIRSLLGISGMCPAGRGASTSILPAWVATTMPGTDKTPSKGGKEVVCSRSWMKSYKYMQVFQLEVGRGPAAVPAHTGRSLAGALGSISPAFSLI